MAIPINDPSKPTLSDSPRARNMTGSRDNRSQYRVHKQGSAQLEATLITEDGRQAVGECMDLSVGGVGVMIPQTKDLGIVEGARLRVRVHHLGRPKGIEAAAEVVTISHVGTTIRFGLRFVKISEVVAQIDPFYARWFNRRRSARVMPDFATKVACTLRWSDGELEAKVHDISVGGLGLLATSEEVSGIGIKGRVELSFSLPNTPLPIVCRAKIVSLKTFTKNVLVGLAFEPNGGIERYAAGLQRYVDERQRCIAQYNEAMAQQAKRAS
jgi:c-di-GMP-binding flagellar brake protein YcgR